MLSTLQTEPALGKSMSISYTESMVRTHTHTQNESIKLHSTSGTVHSQTQELMVCSVGSWNKFLPNVQMFICSLH